MKRQSAPEVLRIHTSTSVLIMGLKNVGKTTVLKQLEKISSRDLGLDDRKRRSENSLDGKVPEQLQYSEATQFPFKGLRKMAIKAAEAFVLTYAVDDQDSFDYVTKLLSEIITIKGDDVPLVVVANKIDKSPREVHPIIADCVVTIDFECKHKEVCAASGEGIKDVLSCLLGFYGDSMALPDENKNSFRKRFSSLFRK
ncbi:GTP-binding protein Di-Ras1-like [Mercenaria mercenaria]|uniref:GTP-binding protein Di-Ras1-like n=1 Tax=Mercenaria mercenaria TaxID=6596 RepID=UPI00234FA90D|nr:GTP-binding protein Di-Ras1-like [Mercenaria mercenaria]